MIRDDKLNLLDVTYEYFGEQVAIPTNGLNHSFQ